MKAAELNRWSQFLEKLTGVEPMTTVGLATSYILAVKECRELDAELKRRKEARDALEQELLAAFRDEGVQSIRTSEGLAYLRRDIWASLSGTPDQLLGGPLEWLIKPSVNQQSLSAVVREYQRDDQDQPILPEEVKALVNVTEVYKVGVRSV
ncbi:MAG TPA: hypothetical protein VIK64_02260 [Anaerolineales bacterium]